jgi:hypothetical protein
MKKIICAACITAFTALAVIIAVCLLCLANEKQTSQNLEEDKGLPSESWKEYRSLVGIWPQLKKEGIEGIRFCRASHIVYREGDFGLNVNTSGYRERAAEVVKWWRTTSKVPKEKLPECIKIIDKAMKKAGVKGYCMVSSFDKMLIVTKKGKYIVHVETHTSQVTGPKAYGAEWESKKLGEFLVKYCMPADGRGFFVLPEERPAAILIFPMRNLDEDNSYDSLLTWPPVVLFGDKKEAEKLLARSFEPKMTFEGGEWIDKIIDVYRIALKNAEEKRSRRKDVNAFEGWIVFLTPDEFYWGGIDVDENAVYGDYIIESKQLKAYFDELGLTKELLAGEPNKVTEH